MLFSYEIYTSFCIFQTLFCLAAVATSCSGAPYLGYPGAYGFLSHNLLGHTPYTHNPVPYSVNPISYNVAPVAPVQSQYHAQDELGQYSFGYSGGPSSRAETRDAYGIVRGSYNYVDSEGKVQTNHYVADGLGFRVSGTNLPVAPEAPEAPALVAPEPVMDTPEVAAAKASFKMAYDEAAAAAEAAPDSRKKRSVVAPAAYPYTSPLRFGYSFSTPLTYPYSAAFPGFTSYGQIPAATTYGGIPAATTYGGIPAATTYAVAPPATVRDANLLRVVHNPGHAVSYRVD